MEIIQQILTRAAAHIMCVHSHMAIQAYVDLTVLSLCLVQVMGPSIYTFTDGLCARHSMHHTKPSYWMPNTDVSFSDACILTGMHGKTSTGQLC